MGTKGGYPNPGPVTAAAEKAEVSEPSAPLREAAERWLESPRWWANLLDPEPAAIDPSCPVLDGMPAAEDGVVDEGTPGTDRAGGASGDDGALWMAFPGTSGTGGIGGSGGTGGTMDSDNEDPDTAPVGIWLV